MLCVLKPVVWIGLVCLVWIGPSRGQALPTFEDVTQAAGLQVKHSYGDFDLSNIVEGTGSGALFFDYDGDGWQDIYFVQGCWLKEVNDNRGRKLRGKLANQLYRNNGNGTFTDVTAKAGVGDQGFGTGCSAADYDADGDPLNYSWSFVTRSRS